MINIRFTVPTKWDELTPWQADKIGGMLFWNKIKERQLFIYALVFVLFLPRPTFKNVLKAMVLFFTIPLSELQGYTDFVFDKEMAMTRFRPCYKVRRGWFRKVKLYGPAQRMANSSILELSYADAFFYKWVTEGKDIDLHRLCAVLYRERDPNAGRDDLRLPFNELLLSGNAALTDKIPLHEKYMIALAYQGTRRLFGKRYPMVFPQSKAKDADAADKKPKAYSPFTKIINAMVLDEIQPLGTLEQAERTSAHKFLEIYNESLIRQREEQKRLDKLKKKR